MSEVDYDKIETEHVNDVVKFVLQKSNDGVSWREMGEVGALGEVEGICRALRNELPMCRYRIIRRTETVVF